MRSDVIDIRGQIHHRTERAILFSDDGDRENAVWLSLAHIEVEMLRHGIAIVTLPEWLAVEKGMA